MIILQKYELYLSAFFCPWSIVEPLELDKKLENRLFWLTIPFCAPGLLYAAYLINRHYDDYVARQQSREIQQGADA